MSKIKEIVRIIDNKNSMVLVEMSDGSKEHCHIDMTTHEQRMAFIKMREAEIRTLNSMRCAT